MSIHITSEITEAFAQYMAEAVDCDLLGNPIRRSDVGDESLLTFAAGYQLARRTELKQGNVSDAVQRIAAPS
jgi:hypothetical protein